MNAQDRKTVSSLISQLEELQSKFENIKSEVEELANAEQEKFDNMTENLQQTEKGQAIESAASTLNDAANSDNIEEMMDALNNIEQ